VKSQLLRSRKQAVTPPRITTTKLYHAAAVAMLGWYLIAAPANTTYASLSRWRIIGTYDYASDCQNALHSMSATPDSLGPKERAINKTRAPRLACIATDDPRLRGDYQPFYPRQTPQN
jgi:hypothetical protein